MDKPRIISSSNKPKIITSQNNPAQNQENIQQKLEAQAIKDITPVSGSPQPFQMEGDLKQKIEEDQKKRKQGFFDRIKGILRI